ITSTSTNVEQIDFEQLHRIGILPSGDLGVKLREDAGMRAVRDPLRNLAGGYLLDRTYRLGKPSEHAVLVDVVRKELEVHIGDRQVVLHSVHFRRNDSEGSSAW